MVYNSKVNNPTGAINCVSNRNSVCIRQKMCVGGGKKKRKIGTKMHARNVIRIGFGQFRNIDMFGLRRIC